MTSYTSEVATLFEAPLKGAWTTSELQLIVKSYVIKDSVLLGFTAVLNDLVDLFVI